MNYVNIFRTQNPTTGALQDADALPTASLYRNGALDEAAVLTVTKVATGTYKVTGEFVLGTDRCCVLADATVEAIAGGDVVDDLSLAADVATVAAGMPSNANLQSLIAAVQATGGVMGKLIGVAVGDGAHVTDATSAEAITLTCPVGTKAVLVNCGADFYWSSDNTATTASQKHAITTDANPVFPLHCQYKTRTFSVLVTAGSATELHIQPVQ